MQRRLRDLAGRLARSVRAAAGDLCGRRPGNLPAQEISARLTARTADDVSVELAVAVHYSAPLHYEVLPENAAETFSRLNAARVRFTAVISRTALAWVPNLKFDELFEKREELAEVVKHELKPEMDGLGYDFVDACVVGICAAGVPRSPKAARRDGAKTGDMFARARNGRSALSRWESEGGR